jgi:hypothetical protein
MAIDNNMAFKKTLREQIDGKIRCGSKHHTGDRMRPIEEFCKAKTPDGLSYSCKSCRTKENQELCHTRYKRWKERDPIKAMLQGIKGNARTKGIECTLTADDIVIPDKCPILGIPLEFSEQRTYNTPSVDRIDNARGYTPDNIVVCSWRANILKKDATLHELQAISKFYTLLEENK